jgi:hypothetical protein
MLSLGVDEFIDGTICGNTRQFGSRWCTVTMVLMLPDFLQYFFNYCFLLRKCPADRPRSSSSYSLAFINRHEDERWSLVEKGDRLRGKGEEDQVSGRLGPEVVGLWMDGWMGGVSA